MSVSSFVKKTKIHIILVLVFIRVIKFNSVEYTVLIQFYRFIYSLDLWKKSI
jgi:hypothetical protein